MYSRGQLEGLFDIVHIERTNVSPLALRSLALFPCALLPPLSRGDEDKRGIGHHDPERFPRARAVVALRLVGWIPTDPQFQDGRACRNEGAGAK